MISVAAIRMQQFGVQFYQASLSASDIDKLVRFEVLSYGERAQPVRGGRAQGNAASLEGELGPARAPDRGQREGVSAADHPPQDRRARAVLRTMPSGPRPAVDSGRRDHLLRRGAALRARERGRVGRRPESAGARRHPPGDRRPAPPARAACRHRAVRRRALHRPGGDLRPAARRSRRADVRDHQCEAHAAELVASRLALRPPALPR